MKMRNIICVSAITIGLVGAVAAQQQTAQPKPKENTAKAQKVLTIEMDCVVEGERGRFRLEFGDGQLLKVFPVASAATTSPGDATKATDR